MADLSKIKVGDCIKFTARVASVTEGMVGITRPEAEDKSSQLYLGGRWIEAAEHIPAPRPAFKRRDLVRQISGRGYQEPYRKGIVLIPEGTRPMMPNFVNVHWPHGETSNEDPRNLEPDEAPE